MKRIAALITFILLLSHGFAAAQSSSLTLDRNEVVLDFPTTIRFSADLNSSVEIAKVKLHYGTTQDTCGTVSGVAFPEITSGKSVTVEWEWDMRQSGGEPPGATLWWQWEVVDTTGESTFSEKQQIIWIDDVHDWQTIDKGQIRLHHYYSDAENGEILADTAVSALDRLKTDIGMVPQGTIDLYIYATNDDLLEAVFYEPGWTGGLAYSDYNILIIGVDPYDIEWGKSTVAHELTHILEGDYSFSCLGDTPTWLSEGLAVYGEGGPSQDEVIFFNENVSQESLPSFTVLSGGFSEDPDLANLSYTQSYYMVNYLIEEYGQEKMLELLDLLSSAGELNESLQTAYGFDLNAFEAEWRQSLGLTFTPAVESGVDLVPTPIPTIIPIQGAQSMPAAPQNSEPTLTQPDSAAAESPTETSASPTPTRFKDGVVSWVPWILAVALFNGVILLIVFLSMRRKGGQK